MLGCSFAQMGGNKGGFEMPTMWDDWKPISTAPNNRHILLGWSDGGGEFDFLFDAGELHDGEWLDGDTQPDWWMDGPPPPPRKRQG